MLLPVGGVQLQFLPVLGGQGAQRHGLEGAPRLLLLLPALWAGDFLLGKEERAKGRGALRLQSEK